LPTSYPAKQACSSSASRRPYPPLRYGHLRRDAGRKQSYL